MRTLSILLLAALAVSACATKSYPMATPLGVFEASAMSCHDLDLELVRVDGVRKQISDTAKIDWRSAAGFLGDFGIGNAMAKSDAQQAIDRRVAALQAARRAKGCASAGPAG
jgi:hypothetical protein